MADSSENSPTPPAPRPRPEAEILADPHLRALLAGYQPLYQEIFLASYARVLSDLYYQGEKYEDDLNYLLRQYDITAYDSLWTIQHQKLFDLECRWRAGLVEVPEARLTADFDDWHSYIEECRVLPPISPEELALFTRFLAQLTDSEDLREGNPSQEFWRQRRFPHCRANADASYDYLDDCLTPWTKFWDQHWGTGYLRQLSDERGDQEFRYEAAVWEEFRRQQLAAAPPPDPRPPVPTYGDEHDALVRDWLRRLEPPARLRQFEAKEQLEAYHASRGGGLSRALERLQDAGPLLVPIEAHADWRRAVIAAGHRHYLGQLRAALPQVYEAYCQREALGINHAPISDYRYHARGSIFANYAKKIREGRRLLGEPDNLDF